MSIFHHNKKKEREKKKHHKTDTYPRFFPVSIFGVSFSLFFSLLKPRFHEVEDVRSVAR
jgi:hypothetical protein